MCDNRFRAAAFVAAMLLSTQLFCSCGAKLACEDLAKKLDRCGEQVYLSISAPEARFIEELTTTNGGLDPDSRKKLSALWTKKKAGLVAGFVSNLKKKCTRDKGRFRESKKLNDCLKLDDCSKFAECFKKAVKIQ